MVRRLVPTILCLCIWMATPARAEGPNVVASIGPVHSLLSGVMQGIGTPELLLRGGGSPHDYALKPSAARLLHKARLVFWVGPSLEGFLVRPLAGLAGKVGVIQLSVGGHDDDPHIWLDPRIAATIVGKMVAALAGVDGANRARYEANGRAMKAMLVALDKEIHDRLKPVAVVPYLVFHDAYRYFEKRYDLASQGAVAVHEGRAPGARRIAMLRRKIIDTNIACVFTEPQFEPALATTLIEGTGARTAVLDPLGTSLKAGPELYPALMRGLVDQLLGCLGANG
ncbi:MAG: zinc ABC transporter substrate-binding protein [Rhodospirillales bacterium]|nr:zinc ABC transporter substrate-binding protein [Rhodospirillales bacterium]